MRELYLANVAIHVLAALFWSGRRLSFALVGAPALRRIESPGLPADAGRRCWPAATPSLP